MVTDPVAMIDAGPTLPGIADVTAPKRQCGQVLLLLIQGERAPDPVVPSFYKEHVTLRHVTYRLIHDLDAWQQIVDREEDFWQLRDLCQNNPAFLPSEAKRNMPRAAGLRG